MAEKSAVVNKIIPFSSVDGPGNRTAVFLQGCNYSCLYCHNPETIRLCTQCGRCIKACPSGALSWERERVYYNRELCTGCDTCLQVCENLSSPKTREMSVAEVTAAIQSNMPYIRGITISGGECTCQKEFVQELLTAVKELGLSCYLDSNGSLDFAKEPELLAVTDKVMLDVKAFDADEHKRITGADPEIVKRNLLFLAEQDKLYEVRTVIVPNLFDVWQTIREVSAILQHRDVRRDIRYKLITYRSMGVREPYRSCLVSPKQEYMQALKRWLLDNGWQDVVIL